MLPLEFAEDRARLEALRMAVDAIAKRWDEAEASGLASQDLAQLDEDRAHLLALLDMVHDRVAELSKPKP